MRRDHVSTSRGRRGGLLRLLAGAAVLTAGLLAVAVTPPGGAVAAAGAGRAAQDAAAAPEYCRIRAVVQEYVCAATVAADLTPSGDFVDSRWPGRTLKVSLSSKFHYLVHTGLTRPGQTIRVTVYAAGSGIEAFSQTATADRLGGFATEPADVASFAYPGTEFTVVVDHLDGELRVQQTLVEYGLLVVTEV